MKSLVIAVVALLVVVIAAPAWAHLVQVVTYVPLDQVKNQEHLSDALEAAVREVLEHTIAFTPTTLKITFAHVVGDRLYVGLLIADNDGEATLLDVSDDGASETVSTGWRPPGRR